MSNWLIEHSAPLVTTFGLVCDIAGAVLVASEVVRQYHGRRFTAGGSDSDPAWGPKPVHETAEFQSWQTETYFRMKLGLGFLLVGFLLQIAGTWVSALSS